MALQDLTPQLRTRLGRVERLVGLFLSFALLLLLVGFVYFLRHTAKVKGWFVHKVPYFTFVEDGTGIAPGADVRMTGFKVGQVTRVTTMPMEPWAIQNRWHVFVEFQVQDPYFGYILTDSSVRLGAGDLLGGRSVEVLRGQVGLVTVTNLPHNKIGVLHEKFATESNPTKRTNEFLKYLEDKKNSKGYYLKAEEQQPLPEKLTRIANDLHAALPGVLAMTNTLNQAMTNMNSLMAKLDLAAPRIQAAMGEAEGLLRELRPLTQKPGGLGELLVPTNLNHEITTILSNVNSRSELSGPTLSNINLLVTQIGGTVSNLNSQLERDTNLVGNVSRLAESASDLSGTANTLLRRHWLFRGAFKTNSTTGIR